MPGMQRVVYAKSSKVLAATSIVYCLLANYVLEGLAVNIAIG